MRFQVPHPKSFLLATIVILAIAVGLRFGLPIILEQEAIRRIEQLGGTVSMSDDGAPWLKKWVGDSWARSFNHAVGVSLIGAELLDKDLAPLRWMPNVRVLLLDATPVTDQGLQHIAQLPRLSQLSLDYTNVTGKGMAHLVGLQGLRALSLDGTPIKDAELLHISRLSALESLSLDDTSVTDAGMELLCSSANLSRVSLDHTHVTDAGRDKLKKAFEYMHFGNPEFFFP